ncbi:MAG: LPS export ABC transporter permease LptG [Bdellovibrionales bacterium]|nr:LPS export ABC transporter permease LptG [Bdellovibrionales bacterium]
MISIIDRYISKTFLIYFMAGLIVFVTIFLAVDFMGAFSRYEVTTDVLLTYYGYSIPMIVYQMIPVGCLVATVFTFSTFNKSNELVAMYSIGLSLARISAPILSLIALISVFSFWLGDHLLPEFSKKKNYVYYVEIKKKPGLYSTVKTDKIWYRSENILFNIKSLNTDKKQAFGITLYFFDDHWKLVQLIKAKTVDLKGSVWELKNGQVTLFAKDLQFPVTKAFTSKMISMNEDVADLENASSSGEVMTLNQLKKFIKKNKEAGLDTLRYEVDYHSKYGFAFAAFVMSLIGIPFSVKRQRSGGAFVNIGICMGLAFLYWVLFSSGITMGKHGLIPPVLAAWGANAIGMVSAGYLLTRLKQ